MNHHCRFGCKCEKVKLAEMNISTECLVCLHPIHLMNTRYMSMVAPKWSNENRIMLCVCVCVFVCLFSFFSRTHCGMNLSNGFDFDLFLLKNILMAIGPFRYHCVRKNAQMCVCVNACFISNWINPHRERTYESWNWNKLDCSKITIIFAPKPSEHQVVQTAPTFLASELPYCQLMYGNR